MPIRDFFVFCTSLSPLELRAVGALSRVRHFAPDETIYTAGDSAQGFFIINRGLVELAAQDVKTATACTVMARGDIFGDLELITDCLRLQQATARDEVSLQCFNREDFSELVRRVPSFYQFLCEKLAQRLIQAHAKAAEPPDVLELTGSLANFDLVTIYQTIAQSTQTGQLSIVSETGELISEFHFTLGQPITGRFQHLAGEDAFWQLFLAENLKGAFSFCSDRSAVAEARVRTLNRPATDLLFTAMQFRDELSALKAELPSTTVCEISRTEFSVTMCHPEISPVALEQVWRCLAERPLAITALFPRCSVCELKIYQAVQELERTGHLALSGPGKYQRFA
ncbi:MAG: cyclic nucleotide-binding domain-containing protein [Chthoniobacterales bacterium]